MQSSGHAALAAMVAPMGKLYAKPYQSVHNPEQKEPGNEPPYAGDNGLRRVPPEIHGSRKILRITKWSWHACDVKPAATRWPD